MLISAARSHTHPRWGERVLGMQPTWAQRHPAHAAASLLAHSTTLSSSPQGNKQRGRGRGWTGHEGMRYAPCVSCRRSRGEVETCMTLRKGDGESVYGAVCALCFALWLPGGCKRLCWGRGCLAPCCERGKRVRFVPLAAPGPAFLLPPARWLFDAGSIFPARKPSPCSPHSNPGASSPAGAGSSPATAGWAGAVPPRSRAGHGPGAQRCC